LKLACCLTNDHCQSYGCDESFVYDWYYGCTNLDFGKQKSKANLSPESVPKITWNKLERQSDNLNITIETNVASTCKIGTFGTDYDTLEWPMSNQESVLLHSATISCDQIKQSKISCDQDFTLLAICRNQAGDSKPFYQQTKIQANKVAVIKNSACNDGYSPCGHSCYSSSFETCVNGTIDCKTEGDIFTYDISKTMPMYICNDSHNVVQKLTPIAGFDYKSTVCKYVASTICGTQQKCSNGKCVDDPNSEQKEAASIIGEYDSKTGQIVTIADSYKSGVFVDDTGKEIKPIEKKFATADGTITTITCASEKEYDNLNAALALIASSTIKTRQWFKAKNDQEMPQNYVCANFADDTVKMLNEAGIKDVYFASLIGTDGDGNTNGERHSIIGIGAGKVQYTQSDGAKKLSKQLF